MLESEFFLFIAVAIFSYGIQVPLLVYFARKMDGLIVTVYRNLSLGITMLPIFFFVTIPEILAITAHIQTLLLASGFGAFGFICNLGASRHLPIGIANSVRQAAYVIIAVILGILFLQEYLTLVQLIILAGILSGGIMLTLTRSSHTHLKEEERWRGIFLAVLGGFGYALAFFFYSILSREVTPLVAGYFWEVTIGVIALLYLLYKVYRGNYTQKLMLSWREMITIVLISLTTISGTISYGFAVNYGPYALASGLVTTTVLITTLMGWILFKEKLTLRQLMLIIGVIGLIFILRLVS